MEESESAEDIRQADTAGDSPESADNENIEYVDASLADGKEIDIPADVPEDLEGEYVENFKIATHNTGRLMLFAGDQKVEHLNNDFYGTSSLGPIPEDDNHPEHLFRIASQGTIGVFAAQLGLVARYGPKYPDVNYLVKLNSKTNLVGKDQMDPYSHLLWDVEQVVALKESSDLNILGVGYTIYLGSEYEGDMLEEAAQVINDAHAAGLLVVLWIYPRGKAVQDEKDPHLIAGATGVANCLGADFVKVNYPKKEGVDSAVALKEAVLSAGNTHVVCAGGSSTDFTEFLERLHRQLHVGGVKGNATGRNIHQKPLDVAVRMCDAISALTLGLKDVEFATRVYKGEATFKAKPKQSE
ncbi:MAG: aldolase [DPANN group archaeon]|nr:aldolase [DPANN group archaeon]